MDIQLPTPPNTPVPADYTGTPAPTDPIDAAITGFFDQARARVQSSDWASVFQKMLTENDALPSPKGMPVPAATNPFGRMASVFAATLADQLGARGTAAGIQDKFATQDAQKQHVQEFNMQLQQQADHEKAAGHLRLETLINEAKMEQAKQMGNLDELESRLKTQRQLRNEQTKLNEAAKLREIDAQNKEIFARVMAGIKARGEQARQTLNYKKLAKDAVENGKASDALKLWGKTQYANIFAKDIAGDYEHTDQEREQMAQELYTEFLKRAAEEKHPDTSTGTEDDLFNF